LDKLLKRLNEDQYPVLNLH